MYQCFHCGARAVYWNADFDFEDYGLEGEGIIHECTCGNCGAQITYYISIDDEKGEQMKPASFDKVEWIDPWRDRRPMTEDAVLVTAYWHGMWTYGVACYDLEGEDWQGAVGTILAWMPLPDKYNPVEEVE